MPLDLCSVRHVVEAQAEPITEIGGQLRKPGRSSPVMPEVDRYRFAHHLLRRAIAFDDPTDLPFQPLEADRLES